MKLLAHCKPPGLTGGLRTKALLVMKLTSFFLLVFSLEISAKSFSQTVTIVGKDLPLLEVFSTIEKQTGYAFVFDEKKVQHTKTLTLDLKNIPLREALDRCLKDQGLSYDLKYRIVVVKKAGGEKNGGVNALPGEIDGKVMDEKGNPVAGATIQVKGGGRSVVSGADGSFTLRQVDNDAILVVSYIGYQTQEMRPGKSGSLLVTLAPKDGKMNDVVVVAYGQKQRKIETLGAQSNLNVDELKQPVANISTVLAGRISGLVGVQRTGEPGRDNAQIWIRGVATMSNSTPLILVDGVEREFNNLDPNDIESFTILKDASSTAVFGVRGANGVVLITTKRGKAGRTDINLDFYSGITDFTKVPSTADGVTYMQMANEASVTRGGNPVYSETAIRKTHDQSDPYLYPNVNWFHEIFNQFGHNQKANLSIRGGNEKSSFYVSAAYYDETGLFKADGLQQYNSSTKFSRVNFSSAVTIKASKTTTVDLGIKGWISNGNYPGIPSGVTDPVTNIFTQSLNTYPILYPKMYPDGKEPFISTGGGLNSPYALLTNRGYSNTYQSQVLSDLSVKQDLGFVLPGLSARALYSFDAIASNTLNRVKSPSVYYATGRDSSGNLVYSQTGQGQDYLSFSRTNDGSRQFYFEAAINYNRTFGRHKVTGMVLYDQSDKVSAIAADLISSIPYRSLGSVGRFTYSYNDRYLAEATFGYNGAETFAPNHRFGFFPSYALGWVVSNEKFYGGLSDYVQLLKFRASYGKVGNSQINGRRFAYVGTVAATNGYNYGQDRGNAIAGVDIQDYPVDATWETEKDINLGLDLKTLNNALYIQADVFSRHRTNIFLQRQVVPDFLGIRSNLLGNLGIVDSKGIDLTAEYNQRFGQLNISLRGTFTYNTNKRIEDDSPIPPYPWQSTRGVHVNYRMGYVAEGYYTQAEIADPKVARTAGVVQAGDIKFKDLNGDGVIDVSDQKIIGKDQIPQVLYGFGTTLSYKNWSLGSFWQGTALVNFYFANSFMPFRYGSTKGGLYSNILDRWTPQNPSQQAFYPRLSYGSDINQNYTVTNTHWLMNGRFLRMKTLDFGYTFTRNSLKRYGVQNMRVYAIAYNLVTISPFKMWDPELGDGSGTVYPNIRTFSLGINATF